SMAISQRHQLLICSCLLMGLVLLGQVVAFEALLARFYTQEILAEFVLGMGCYAVYARTGAWRRHGMARSARGALLLVGLVALAYMPMS
ncbi:hypothetical protein NL393_34780, partial [Klebsiella pneumoniae]|nr:hypothetical protein [Klebsiella pneumoniae]